MYDDDFMRDELQAQIAALSKESHLVTVAVVVGAGAWGFFYSDTLALSARLMAGGFLALGLGTINQVYQLRLDGLRRDMRRHLMKKRAR